MSGSTVRRAGIRIDLEGGREVQRGLREIGQQGDRSLGQIVRSANLAAGALRVLGPLSGAISFAGLIGGTQQAIRAAEEFQRSALRTEAILRSTGNAAGLTGQQIREFAQSIARETLASVSGVEQAAQQLLTFRSVSGEVFERTLRAAQDLAAVGFGSLASNAVSLGRALEAPTEGLNALRRAGITFTESQRQVIAQLDETGRRAEAQRLILEAVERQVGGAGRAEAGGLAGAYDSLGQTVQEFLVRIGNLGPLQAATAAIQGLTAVVAGLDAAIARLTGGEPPVTIAQRAVGAAEERVAALRRQAEAAAAAQPVPARRGTIGTQAARIAQGQVGDQGVADRAAALAEAEQALRAAQERLFRIVEEGENARLQAAIAGARERAEIERDQAAQALRVLQERSDRALAIERQFQRDVATVRRAEAAGAVDGDAARQQIERLEAARREALERLTARSSGGAAGRAGVDTELNRLLSDREAVIRRNETAQERYNRQIAELDALVARLAARGDGLPADVEIRERTRLLEEMNAALAETDSSLQELGRLGEQAFDRIGSAITQMALEGRTSFASLRNVGNAVASELLQAFWRLAALNPLRNLLFGGSLPTLGGLIGSLGFGGGYGAGPNAMTASGGGFLFHSGGIVGRDGKPTAAPAALWREAPRYHSGGFPGLRSDEVPAILQRGEGVFTPAQMQALGRGSGAVVNVTFAGGDMGSEADRRAMAEQLRGVIRQEIGGAMPRMVEAAHAYSMAEVRRGGMAAREFGRR